MSLPPRSALVLNLALIAGGVLALLAIGTGRSQADAEGLTVGAVLPAIPGLSLARDRPTLVLAIRSGCVFSDRSMPFYRRLSEQAATGALAAHVVALTPDPETVARRLLRIYQVQVPVAAGVPLASAHLTATPVLVLVAPSGAVLGKWEGQLTTEGEAEVLRAISHQPVRARAVTGRAGGGPGISEGRTRP